MKRVAPREIGKKILALILVFSFIVPLSFFTVNTPKKAEADTAGCAVGVVSAVISLITGAVPSADAPTQAATTGTFVNDCILKPIAIKMARTMVQNISNSIVNWINNDFNGKPGFVTDIRGLVTDSADEVIGDMIYGSDLQFLCSPFSFQVRLALATKYSQPFKEQVRCTLTDVIDNVNNFADNNGGATWDRWLSVTTEPQNNVYGAYLMAESQLAQNIQTKLDDVNNMLNRNGGFLDFQTCDEYETPLEASTRAGGGAQSNLSGSNIGNNLGTQTDFETFNTGLNTVNFGNGNVNIPSQGSQLPSFASTNESVSKPQCKKMSTKTPGSLVQQQANKVLGNWSDQLNLADSIDQIVGALISKFTDKMISGATGFLGLSGSKGYASNNITYAQASTLSADTTNPNNAGLDDVNTAAQQGLNDTVSAIQVINTQLLESSGINADGTTTDDANTSTTDGSPAVDSNGVPLGGIETLSIASPGGNSRIGRSSVATIKSFFNTESNVIIPTVEVNLYRQGVPIAFNDALLNGSVGLTQNGVTRAFYPQNSSGITFTKVSVGPSYNTIISLSGIAGSNAVGSYIVTMTAKDDSGAVLRTATINFVVE